MRTLLLREYENRFPDKNIKGAILSFPELPYPMALVNYSRNMGWFVDKEDYPGGTVKLVTFKSPYELLNTEVIGWVAGKSPLMEGMFIWLEGGKSEKVTRVKEGDGSPYPIVTEKSQYKWSEVKMIEKRNEDYQNYLENEQENIM